MQDTHEQDTYENPEFYQGMAEASKLKKQIWNYIVNTGDTEGVFNLYKPSVTTSEYYIDGFNYVIDMIVMDYEETYNFDSVTEGH